MKASPALYRSNLVHWLLAAVAVAIVVVTVARSPLAFGVSAQQVQISSATARGSQSAASSPVMVVLDLAAGVGQSVAARRLIDFKMKNDPSSSPRYYGIVDFSQPSTAKRFYIIDTVERDVHAYYVAHGRGSEGTNDDGVADVFSNQDGSNASSLGIYRTLGEYNGKHGRSLRLEGLEPTNSNVLARGVVLHTADYATEGFIRQTGRLGRSEGCFAVDPAVGPTLMDQLKPGTYIIAVKN